MSCTGCTPGKDPPRTRLVTRQPPGVTLTGPGEEDEDRYPPPVVIGICWAPPPPIRRAAFLSWGMELMATAPSTDFLAMGTGVLAMGRTTLVTTVGAMRTPLRDWVNPTVMGGWAMDGDRDELLSPLKLPTSFLLGPSWLSSPLSSTPLALLVSGPSSEPPPPPSSLFPLTDEESECGIEGEEDGREERATGWKPCWREDRGTKIKEA